MTQPKTPAKPSTPPAPSRLDKKDRLARALKANLLRRKASSSAAKK